MTHPVSVAIEVILKAHKESYFGDREGKCQYSMTTRALELKRPRYKVQLHHRLVIQCW
jgi:hypothetical protein